MKVNFGSLKGMSIAPMQEKSSSSTRPTSSMTKSVLFNVLMHNPLIEQNINGCIAMDAFCGTGSVGFEFISLGAKKCYFIDNNRDRLLEVSATARKLNIESKIETIFCNIGVDIVSLADRIDILFLDPPYHDCAHLLHHFISSFCNHDNMNEGGIVCAELPRTLSVHFENLEKIIFRDVNKNTNCSFWKIAENTNH